MSEPPKEGSIGPTTFGQADLAERVEMADFAEAVAGIGTYLVRDGRAHWSVGMRRLLGFQEGEVLDTPAFFARVHPDDRERMQAQFGRVMSGKAQPVTEFRICLPDGSVRHLRGERLLRADADGRTTLVGAALDVTRERTALRDVETLLARHHEAQRAAEVGTFVRDLGSGRETWSPELFRIFGVSPELAPSVVLMLRAMPEEDRIKHEGWLGRATTGETVEPLVVRVDRADGQRSVELRCRRVLGPDGAFELLGVAIDVTVRATLEEQLRQAAALEAVGTLAAGVAHDFNNQLTVMSLQLRRLERVVPGDDVEALRHALEQSSLLTRQLLALARKEQGPPRVIEVTAVCRRVADILGRVAEPDLTVVFEAPDDVMLARVDEVQVEGAVMNLAFNARDAMPRGGTLTISVSRLDVDDAREGAPTGSFVRIAVSDTGTGIPSELVGRIFEPYFTTKELGRGTGLGLASVQAIARQHGGSVQVESDRERGTTLALLLPSADRMSRSTEIPRPAPSGTALVGKRVLVAEDNASLLALVARSLAELGAEVLTADNGAVALEVLRERGPVDVVLTDVRMPVLDGLGLAAELVQASPRTPVVFMTGYAESELAGSVDAEGTRRRVLLKPFQLEDLVGVLSRAIAASRGSGPG
jgi:PAS domain S-box-containing protein